MHKSMTESGLLLTLKECMKINNFFWILPFICFIVGYLSLNLFIDNQVKVPSLIGLSLEQAVATASSLGLNVRIVMRKEDATLPSNTVLNQTPHPQQIARTQQTVFLVISCTPEPIKAPNCLNKCIEELPKELTALGLQVKTHWLPSDHPAGNCLAQIPSPDQPCPQKIITLYGAQQKPVTVIMPSFIGSPLPEAIEFLQEHDISPEIVSTQQRTLYQSAKKRLVKEQRPVAGTLITLSANLSVQLYVE